MYTYVLYFTLIALSPLLYRNSLLNRNNHLRKIYCAIITVFLVCISGLRSISVGIDTEMYQAIWNYQIAGDFERAITYNESESPTYVLMCFFKYVLNYNGFLFVIAILTITPICYVIYKYSKICFFSFLIYYSSIYFHTLEFAAMRQSVAFGFAILSFHFAQQKQLYKYLIFLIIAILFHHSAIVFLPCYWLVKLKLNRHFMTLWTVTLIISFVVGKILFDYLNLFSRIDYSESDQEAGGERLFFLMLILVIIGFINYKVINKHNYISAPFILFSISLLLRPLLVGNPALSRLQYYNDFFMCLFVPNIVYYLPKRNVARLSYITIVLFYSIYVVLVMRQVPAYYPYFFFWEH